MGRVVVQNGVKTLVKPDHYTLVLSFKDIPVNRNKVKQETEVRFNLNKPNGWENYKVLTEDCKDLLKIVNDEEETIENMYDRFGKIHTKIKFKCFGKTRVKKNGNKNEQTNENNNTTDDDKMND